MAFTARGGFDLYVRSLSEAAPAPIVSDGYVKVLNDWSPDGKEIIYSQLDQETKLDLWSVPLSGGPPRPLLKTRFNETQARISPDGRWMAYMSDKSGAPEVYVQSYPPSGDARKVSVAGGSQPQWRRDRSQLFYLSPDNSVMEVATRPEGAISFGTPKRLFRTPIAGSPSDVRDSYAAMGDGQSFVLEGPPDVEHTARISVMVNWTAGLTPELRRSPTTDRWRRALTRLAGVP
jgi:hypothetical protein